MSLRMIAPSCITPACNISAQTIERAESYARLRFAESLTGEDLCNGAGTKAWLKLTGFQSARFAAA